MISTSGDVKLTSPSIDDTIVTILYRVISVNLIVLINKLIDVSGNKMRLLLELMLQQVSFTLHSMFAAGAKFLEDTIDTSPRCSRGGIFLRGERKTFL